MRQPMTLVDLIADYVVMHLRAEHRPELAEFLEEYLDAMYEEAIWQ